MACSELELSSGLHGVFDAQFPGGAVEGLLTSLVVVHAAQRSAKKGVSFFGFPDWDLVACTISLPDTEPINGLTAALNLS